MNLAELDEGPSPQDVLAKMERMNPKIRIKLMKFIDNMDTFESFDTF